MKLYVIYSDIAINFTDNSVLIPIESPRQNYSELWAQYKIWNTSNQVDEYIGFFHFRRYLDFTKPIITELTEENMIPYSFKKFPDIEEYTEKFVAQLFHNFDIIAPLPEYSGIPVIEYYGMHSNQRRIDLEIIRQIIYTEFPLYKDAADTYLSGKSEYYGNIYIMRRSIMDTYFTWLFSILFKFEHIVINPMPRTQGYLAERLFGIWLTQHLQAKDLRCGFLPRVHFYGYDDRTHHFRRKALINCLLPPGSKGREKCLKMKYWLASLF